MKIKFYMEDGSTPIVSVPFTTPQEVSDKLWPPSKTTKCVSFHGQPKPGRPGEEYSITLHLDKMISAEYPV
jgi:hypothetical protein